ncbi:hypothetical protein [Actinophytocola gossypii]|uniref:Secreted protein n=1 Tax=Actinophytocola gossypii TaxID=2812003 RepID=A0ABT2JDX4_9PSEU|nr:hypothetical protein [Actinophytocola gossypii]MCT2586087.1 hypothetical protein [Actinophytocola gossypii]
MIKKAAITLGASLALAAGGAMFTAPVAHADSSASTTGARATFTSYGEVFRLYDTKCDGNPVYLVYSVNNGTENRHNFSGGCGESAKYNKSFAEGAYVEYKACVDIRPGIDKCSGWSDDNA